MYATYEAKTIIIDRRRPRKIQRRDDEQSMPQEGGEDDFFCTDLCGGLLEGGP